MHFLVEKGRHRSDVAARGIFQMNRKCEGELRDGHGGELWDGEREEVGDEHKHGHGGEVGDGEC